MSVLPLTRRTLAIAVIGTLVTALAIVATPGILPANADKTSLTFGYSDEVQTLTVPDGITQLTVSMLGAEGGIGGWDSVGPLPGGYRGLVTGTLAVTPGQVITIGVGHGGYDGQNTEPNAYGGTGGSNPIDGYQGGTGGIAGPEGDSGGGAGGGAATILRVGDQTIVAGGGGGGGGSGQFQPTQGRPGAATFTASADPTTGIGQNGIDTVSVCVDGIRCDGGASGAGGGGAIGGAPGQVAYGADYSTEYFGYGGSPGGNDATGLTGASAVYQWYDGNDADGSVTISYDTSAPTAPTAVSGTAADGSVAINWLAPLSTGGSPITDYAIQYAIAGDSPDWQDFADATSTGTSAVVTGLVDDTDYVFRVSAINAFGTSDWSDASGTVTPSAVPSALTLSSLASSDGALVATFTAVTATSPVTGYQYRVDSGAWIAAGSSSPITIGALTNGVSYTVAVRAVNAIGFGAASDSLSGTPVAVPGAPTITGVTTGIGSAVVGFSAGNAGGSPVTGYDYRLDSGAWVSTGSTTSPFTVTGLANSTSYVLTLRATTSAGAGAASAPATFDTPTTPSAPTIGTITAGDGTLSVNFSAGGNGGLGITGYDYRLTTAGGWTASASGSSPLLLMGLTNGTDYEVSVRARNVLGVGDASGAVTARPVTTPGAPTLLAGSVAGSDQELDASFTAPASDGGSTITGYEYSTDGGVTWRSRATGTTGSPLAITTLSTDGTTTLVNGTTYPVEVRAVNAVGSGTSSGVAVGIARTVPAAPAITAVTSLPGALSVSIASASNGGSPLTSYEYRLNAGPWSDTGTLAQAFTIAGLTDGTTYAVQVRAVNDVGPGVGSGGILGTPASQPGQPTLTGIASGNSSLAVSAIAGATGGALISGWQYSTDAGSTWAGASGLTGPFTISAQSGSASPLVNGVSYSVALRAVNSAGAGAASTPLHAVPMTVPSAPTVTVTPQDSALSVSYAAGSSGGSSVTGVQYTTGGPWLTAGSLQNPFTIGSLTNGTSYPVQVRLVNAVGFGAASTIAAATPRSVPTAPLAVSAAPDGGQATAAWLAPASDGGSPVTGYTATAWSSASNGSAVSSCTSTDLSCVLTGLTNGIAYFVSVAASNAAGEGIASTPRTAVVPLAKPGAPSIYALIPSDTYLNVYYNDGELGSYATTGLEYSIDGGDWTPTAYGSNPLVISGLHNGTTYSVTLRELNLAGAGPASEPASATPFGEPDVPDGSLVTATSNDMITTVNWVAPNDNGSPIYLYNVVAWSSAVQGYQYDSCEAWSGDTSCSMMLWPGQTYYISVDATNAAGTTTRSTPRLAVSPGVPAAVTDLSGVAGDGQVDLSWTPDFSGGFGINDYTVWYAPVGSTSFTQFGDVWTDPEVVVDGLTNGTDYNFRVIAENWFGTSPAASAGPFTPLNDGSGPSFTAPVSTDDGFTTTISNFDGSALYSVSTDRGVVAISGSAITVTGLTVGQQATITVTVAPVDVPSAQGTLVGNALLAGATPQFGPSVRTVDGYTVSLIDPVDGVSYTATTSDGDVSTDGTTFTVTGLAPGGEATITVLATRDGHLDASADITSAALATGDAPLLGTPVATNDGYTVRLLNPDETGSYGLATTAGSASRTDNTFTVSGLDPGESATLTVTALRPGYTDESATADGVALELGASLRTGAMNQFADGFSVPLTDYDPTFDYVVTTSAGILSFVDGTITITGLGIGEVAIVTVHASKDGHRDADTQIGGNPYPLDGTVPILTTPVSTATGFTTTISNYSADSDYTLTVDAGQVSRVGANVTVTGLAAAQTATATVAVDKVGYFQASISVRGAALAAPVAGATPDVTPAPAAADVVTIATDLFAPGPGAVEKGGSEPAATHVDQPKPAANQSGGSTWLAVAGGSLVLLIAVILFLAWLRRRLRVG